MERIIIFLLLPTLPCFNTEEQYTSNELYTVVEKGPAGFADAPQRNQSRQLVKESSLPINEPLEKSSRAGESKLTLHPLPSSMWPKHSDIVPLSRHHNLHNKSKKGLKTDRLIEHNSEKTREGAGLPPKIPLTGSTASFTNKTAQKTHQDPLSSTGAPQVGEPEAHPNARFRPPPPPPPQLQIPAGVPRRDATHRRMMDPEENRPGKSSLYQSGIVTRNSSRPSVLYNRRSSSLLYHFDVLRRESDFTHDAFCLSECRKEKDEREHYCYSEFAINGIVHDIDVLRKGVRLITLMVTSDGFYKMSRLYMTPDSFFFKVRLLVVDTFKCSKPCPDIKLGTRYIVMGQIYHRRRHLSSDLLALVGGKLKPGDGLLRSNSYVKRFNKRRHQKVVDATHSKCR